MADREQLLNGLKDIALKAADAIMSIYQRDFEIMEKSDQSPLTEADLAAHNLICAALEKLTPEIPILSEESADIDWATRKSWSRYWLVDPLDGTKEFIKKNGEFTVNIALIEDNRSTLSVVYAPVPDKLYFADINQGCWLTVDGQTRQLKVTAKAESTAPKP
jgi:3'(2'), 5'-bisphosphate nucleotidase